MAPLKVRYTQIFINNEFVDSVKGHRYTTLNPSNEEVIAEVSLADTADVELAVAAAGAAFEPGSAWRTLNASQRGQLLNKLADLVERDAEHLRALESLDNGKPLKDSNCDLECAVDVTRYFAGWADKIQGQTLPADGPFLSFTRHEPVGVVGAILAWNYPISLMLFKLSPALAAGCTVVVKPADQTPLTALHLAALTREAGFPDGVLNVLPGKGPIVGHTIASHRGVAKLSFTGTTETGRLVSIAAASTNFKRVTLEMGGNGHVIVCSDADVNKAAEIAHKAAFSNNGQNCCSGARSFVHESLYEEFVSRARELAEARRVGDPFVDGVEQGPLVDEAHLVRVLELIDSARTDGARLECGGQRVGERGYFVEPTVFSDMEDDMGLARAENVGPIQQIFRFKSLAEALQRTNRTEFGLAAAIVTKDLNNMLLFSQAAQAGTLWVNTYDSVLPQAPFGGFKQSGVGRELGEVSLLEFLEIKTVTVELQEKR